MTDMRRWTVIPPEQAVVDLVELLTATENKYNRTLAIANAAQREINCRKAFEEHGGEISFLYMSEARGDLEALITEWSA